MNRRTTCFVLLTALALPGALLHADETPGGATASTPASASTVVTAPVAVPAPAPAEAQPVAPAVAPITAPTTPAPIFVEAPAPSPVKTPVTAPATPSVATPATTATPDPESVFAGQTGKWTFSMNDLGSDMKTVSSANQKKLKGSLQEITRLITSTPVMTPPKGFEARFWGSMAARDRYNICTGKKCPPSQPTAFLSMIIGRYVNKGGKAKAAFNTPSTMDVSINNLGQVFSHLTVLHKDAEGYLLPEPAAAGERAGIKTYLNKGRAVMVVANDKKPLWLPVSRERYLKAEMAAIARELGLEPPAEKQSKKKGKGNNQSKPEAAKTQRGKYLLIDEGRIWVDPADEKAWVEKSRSLTSRIKDEEDALKEQLQSLQAELDGLTPEQRSMQARVNVPLTAEGSPVLLPPDSNSGVAVVTPNFSYFNPKLPPDALQLVVFQWKFDGNNIYDPEKNGITEVLNNRALVEIYKTMDWNKLRAKVTQTAL